jgi:hypothetical protein
MRFSKLFTKVPYFTYKIHILYLFKLLIKYTYALQIYKAYLY